MPKVFIDPDGSKHKWYLCIHCKEEFDVVPEERPNECPSGYSHAIIRRSAIIARKVADPYVPLRWLRDG